MIRVRIDHTGPCQGFNILHFAGDLEGSYAQDTADAVAVFLEAIDVGVRNSQTMRVDPEIAQVNIATGQIEAVETVTTAPVVGEAVDEGVPQAANLLLRWRTGLFSGGREVRGRTFLPGFSILQNTATGEVEQDTINFMNAAGETLLANSDLGIYSPTKSLFAEATSVSCWNEWAVMRSRRS